MDALIIIFVIIGVIALQMYIAHRISKWLWRGVDGSMILKKILRKIVISSAVTIGSAAIVYAITGSEELAFGGGGGSGILGYIIQARNELNS